jgi:hypothetical protein
LVVFKKKNTLKPHRRQQWVIPPKANSAFVAAMEDVLAVYLRPRAHQTQAPLPFNLNEAGD